MDCAKTLCDERGIGKVRADRVKRFAWRSDGLTMNARFTDSVMRSRSHIQLLSGLAAAGRVRRLRTGAEAKNVNLKMIVAKLARTELSRGTERTNGCTGGKASLLSATPF